MSDTERGLWTSASYAQRDKDCLGAFLLSRDLPEPPASPESDSGTIVHLLWNGRDILPPRDPTPEEIDKADELRTREVEVAQAEGFDLAKCVRLVETRLWHRFPKVAVETKRKKLRVEVEMLQTSGRFDVALYDPTDGRALIVDGKSGWLDVPPPNSNPQLRRLAVLLWLSLYPKQVLVNILKPFGRQEPCCVYDAEALRTALLEMEAQVRANHDPKSPRTPGEVQCRYCRAGYWGKCAEHAAWLSSALPTICPPLPMTRARDWTPEQRGIFLGRWKIVEKWGGDNWDECKELMQADPQAATGFRLVDGDERETVVDLQTVWTRFQRIGSLTAFMRSLKLTKKTFKEVVRAATGKTGKALDGEMKTLLDGCTVSTQSAPTIERNK